MYLALAGIEQKKIENSERDICYNYNCKFCDIKYNAKTIKENHNCRYYIENKYYAYHRLLLEDQDKKENRMKQRNEELEKCFMNLYNLEYYKKNYGSLYWELSHIIKKIGSYHCNFCGTDYISSHDCESNLKNLINKLIVELRKDDMKYDNFIKYSQEKVNFWKNKLDQLPKK